MAGWLDVRGFRAQAPALQRVQGDDSVNAVLGWVGVLIFPQH